MELTLIWLTLGLDDDDGVGVSHGRTCLMHYISTSLSNLCVITSIFFFLHCGPFVKRSRMLLMGFKPGENWCGLCIVPLQKQFLQPLGTWRSFPTDCLKGWKNSQLINFLMNPTFHQTTCVLWKTWKMSILNYWWCKDSFSDGFINVRKHGASL